MAPRRVWARQDGVFRSGIVHADVPKSSRNVEVDFGSDGKSLMSISQVFDRSIRTETPDDCCALDVLNEPSVLVNLQRRYVNDVVYTFTSTVLLAVNPYRIIPDLYTKETRESYSKIASLQSRPPHPYALADIAYRNVRNSNQVIVISGESGAGKTETAKIVMEYLAERSRTDKKVALDLQNKIMQGANPVFESFGNATTVRNGNSSRFGKYNTLKFDPVGSLVGTEVDSYLLESSRVVHFSDYERTYHVFYELLAGASKEMLKAFSLDSSRQYRLLHRKKMPTPRKGQTKGVEDQTNFRDLVEGLSLVGFPDKEQNQIFRTLAGLIHLGEVSFTPLDDEGCEVLDMCALRLGSELLGFDVNVMGQTLRERNMSVKEGTHVTIYKVKRTAREAQETLESLMKKIYERTFTFIVKSMNRNMAGERTGKISHIGILDIYGFEQLRVNSFEQMCINLANERLQSFFVDNVLRAEQDVYKQEGLQWTPIDIRHSDETTNALTEVMRLLNDCGKKPVSDQQFNPQALDEEFTKAVHQRIKNMKPKRGYAEKQSLDANHAFVVKHYAGEVTYSTGGWIQKNNARLHYQMECILRDSSEPLMNEICVKEGCDGSAAFTSVAREYLKDLDKLLGTKLQGCTLRYVRCFKPNNLQKSRCFDPPVVCEQLVQSGTIELVKIMHLGFPHRCGFDEIKEKFLSKLPLDLQEQDARMLLGALMHVLGLKSTEWSVGLTRVFLKNGLMAVLDKLIGASGQEAAETANKLRRHLRRVKFVRCVNVVRISLWLPGFIKRQRRIQVRNGLVRCCQNLIRIQRWVRRARRRLRMDLVETTIARLQSATRILLALRRWRFRCRRGTVLRHCMQALLCYRDRIVRSQKHRFFDRCRVAIAESKQRLTLFARHALLVAKLRPYVRRRARIRALFTPLVRLIRLKIYIMRYRAKIRAGLDRDRERRERIALEQEIEQLRLANTEKERARAVEEQAHFEELQRLQGEFAVLQQERQEESRKAAELMEERDLVARKAAEFLHARDEEARKAAELQQARDEEAIKLVDLQHQRDEEARKATELQQAIAVEARTISKLQHERDEEARKILRLQHERDEEARKAATLQKLRRREQEDRAEEVKKAGERARKAALAAQRRIEPPAIGPTMSAELARLRAENAMLKEKIADNPEGVDACQVKDLQEEVERLRAKNAQQVREQTVVGVQYLMEENDRLRKRPDLPSSEVNRLVEENRALKGGRSEESIAMVDSAQTLPKRLLANGEDATGIAAKLREQNRALMQRLHKTGVADKENGLPPSRLPSPAPRRRPLDNRCSGDRTTSPLWNPERSFLANTPSLIAHRTSPGMESLEDACCRQNSPVRRKDLNKMILSLSPLSLPSPSSAKFRGEVSFSRFNLEDETRSRLKQPVIRRNAY